jgi:hypothetical protein
MAQQQQDERRLTNTNVGILTGELAKIVVGDASGARTLAIVGTAVAPLG